MLLTRLALRNIGRHARRSLMLGSAIALGTAVLVAANAFAHGISVTLFDKVVVWVAGHAGVFVSESGSAERQLFRDGPWLRAQFEGLPQVKRVDEAVGVFARAIGQGKSDNVILVGADVLREMDAKDRAELEESFEMVEGSWDDLGKAGSDIPVVLAQEKAKALGVRVGDEVRLRFSDVHGARQAAKGKVAGVFRTDNMFMQAPLFVELNRLRDLLGYASWETSGFNLVLHDPVRDAGAVAESLQSRLVPRFAGIAATTPEGRKLTLLGLRGDSATRAAWGSSLGVPDSLLSRRDLALVGPGFAGAESLVLAWPARHGPDSGRAVLRTLAVVPSLPDSVAYWREEGFHKAYYRNMPPRTDPRPSLDTAWIAKEWNLLPRPKTTEEYKQMLAEAALGRDRGAVVSVRTMYEAASDILKLESVLNLITLWAVVTLFLIILIGVLNTLRMTIRERTREIGTLRAVGFQARQILGLFLLETFYLALFSCAAGIALGFALMEGLSLITFHTENNPLGMLLVHGHLFFAPTIWGTLSGVLLITAMAVATAILPSRSAARLPPADALRHHE